MDSSAAPAQGVRNARSRGAAAADRLSLGSVSRRFKRTWMPLGLGSSLSRLIVGTAAFAGIGLAWIVVSWAGLLEPFLLPSPGVVRATAAELVADGTLWIHTVVSLRRVAIGYGLAVAV